MASKRKDSSITRRSQNHEKVFRHSPLRQAIIAALAAPTLASANSITPDGSTGTVVDVDGGITDIRTSTVKGNSGFNSFGRFEVHSGNTVNLHIPGGADNLVNLVHDAKTRINGTLNGLKDGSIGGNIIFADPHGLVVGGSGVVNVGSLVVTTPTAGEMNALVDAIASDSLDGSGMDAEVARLMRGDYQSSDAEIRIEGSINARGGINLFAANAVIVDGAELSVAVEDDAWEVFRSAVNVDGLGGPEGSITIGGEAVQVDGRLATLMEEAGAASVTRQGDVEVEAAEITIGPTGRITTGGEDTTPAGDIRLEARAVDRCLVCDPEAVGVGATDVETPDALNATAEQARVTIEAGGVVDALNDADPEKSGDVEIFAEAEDVQVAGRAATDAEVTIDGEVSGRDVSVEARSLAMTSAGFLQDLALEDEETFVGLFETFADVDRTGFSGVVDAFDVEADDLTQIQAIQDIVSVSIADAGARVDIGGMVHAERDLEINAHATRHADNVADGSLDYYNAAVPFSFGFAYGELAGETAVNVESGATLDVGGDLSLDASSQNTLTQVAAGLNSHDAEGNPLTTTGIAIGIAVADTRTAATVADGVTINTTTESDVGVRAHAEQALTNSVSFSSVGKGATAAPAIAFSRFDSTTQAAFDADLMAVDDLSVLALNRVLEQRNSAETKAGSGLTDHIKLKYRKKFGLTDPYADFVTKKVNDTFNLASSENDSGNTGLRLASALAWAESHHVTEANLGGKGASSVDAKGNIEVVALQHQAELRNQALSKVNSTAKRKDAADIGLSVALVYSDTEQDTLAWVGDDSALTGANIAIGARTEVPLSTDLDDALRDIDKWDSFQSVIDRARDAVDAGKAIWDLPSQYANASGSAEKLSMAGAISVMNTDSVTEAWVGDGVSLTATATDPTAWSSVLYREIDEDGKQQAVWTAQGRSWTDPSNWQSDQQDWQGGVEIVAGSNIERLAVAGNLGKLFGTQSEGGAVGAALNIADHASRTVAGMGVNGQIDSASRVDVLADERNLRVNLAPSAGKGKSVAGNGTAIINLVDSDVIATVDSSTAVRSPIARLRAIHDLGQWSVAGAVAASENAGVGAGLALNDVDTDVRSFVGDVTEWRPTQLPNRAPGDSATWVTDALVVRSESRGQSGAFGIAGALARSKDDKNEDETAKSSDEAQGKSEGLFGSLKSTVGSATGKFGEWKDKLAGYQESGTEEPASTTDVQTEDQSLPVELSAAGAASLNITDQRTHASVGDIVIKGRDVDPDLEVRALTQMQQYSGAGVGALTMGGKDSSKFSSALSGALALNWVAGETTAVVENVEAERLNRLDVTAITGGDHVTFGAGLSVNTSSTDGIAVTMSGSVAANQTRTAAEVSASRLTFSPDAEAERALNVRGYDRTRSLIGGGAFAGASGKGASAGGSVAIGYLTNELSAVLEDTEVRGAGDVTVEAASQTRVLAGALGAAVSGGKGAALAGSGFVVYLDNTVEALVDGGGAAVIESDTLSVKAQSVEGLSSLDALFDDGAGASLADSGLDFDGDVLSDLDTDVEVEDENVAGDDEDPEVETQSLFDSDLSGEFVIGIAGTLAASGKGSGGGAAGVIYTGSDYVATVRDVQRLDVNGSLDIHAENGVETLGVAVGAAGSKNVAMLGSATALVDRGRVSAGLVGDATRADIEAGAVNVDSRHSGGYYSFAGALAASKSAAGGAAVGITDIENTVQTELRNVDVASDGYVGITASGANVIRSASVSGAVSKSTAIGGAFSYNRIDGTTEAVVDDASLAGASITVSSAQEATGASIWSAAGSIAASGSASVGGSIAINQSEGSRESRVEESQLDAAGELVIDSGTAGEIYSFAVGAQASQSVAAGGSAAFNYIEDRSGVKVAGSELVAGSVDVDVSDGASRIATLAGNLNGSGSAAVGGSVATASIAQTRRIQLDDAKLDIGGVAQFDSTSTGEIYSLSVAGAASSSGAVTGAATVGTVESTNEIVFDRVRGRAGNLSLAADDRSTIHSFGLSAGLGGAFGGGAASSVNYIASTTRVGVEGQSVDGDGKPAFLEAGHVMLSASADQTIRTVAAGLGGGGTAGVAGSLAVNVIESTVSAGIRGGARVAAAGNLGVDAVNDGRIQAVSGALSIGGARFGAAGGVGVNVMDSVTEAVVSGENTVVEARGELDDEWLEVGNTDIANAPNPTEWSEPSDFNPVLDLQRGTDRRRGLSVNAQSSQQVGSLSAAVSGTIPDPTGSAAMAGVSTTSVIGGRTQARIEDATVNRDLDGDGQDVHVSAGSNVYSVGYLFAGALSGTAALSGTMDVTLIDHETKADVEASEIRAAGKMGVHADSVRSAANFVTGASGALANGTGSVSVIRLAGLTQARVAGGTASVGSLDIGALGKSRMSASSGSVVVGGISAGGAFTLGVNEAEVNALLGDVDESGDERDTVVQTEGAVSVDADAETDLLVNSVAGSFTGGGSIAGSANLLFLENVTQARMTGVTLRGASGGSTRAGDVRVEAFERSHISSNSGTAGISTAGNTLGASANVVVTNNATRAVIEGSDLRTSGTLDVRAVHELDASLTTVTGGVAPLTAAIGGSFGLLMVGPGAPVQQYNDDTGNDGHIDVDARDELNHGGAGTLSVFDSIGSGDATALTQRQDVADGAETQGDALRGDVETRVDEGAGFEVSRRLEQESAQETRAVIGESMIDAEGDVRVEAEERLETHNVAGSAQAGAVGLGAGGAMTFLRSSVVAGIDASDVRGGNVHVAALARDLSDDERAIDVYALSGSAGFGVGLGAAVAVGSLQNSVTANLGGQVIAEGAVEADAQDALSLRSRADGAAVGAGAAGASIAVAERGSVVQSRLVAGSGIQGDSVSVDSSARGSSIAWARSATGGLGLALNGAISVARDQASVGTVVGNGVNLSGETTLDSYGGGTVESIAEGASVSLMVSVGASLAFADGARTVETVVGDDVTIADEDDLVVSAEQGRAEGQADVRAESFSATGGALVGADASLAFASGSDTTRVRIGDRLTMNGGQLDVDAISDARRESLARGFAVGGALAAGAAWAQTGGDSRTEVILGDEVSLGEDAAMDRVDLEVDATQAYVAESLAGSGGLISGNASVARQDGSDSTGLRLGDGGKIVTHEASLRSDYRGDFGSYADSVNAAVAGASGAFSRSGLTAANTLTFGSTALHVAGGATLAAESDVRSAHPDDRTARAAAGGVISGQAVDHATYLDVDTVVEIRENAKISVGEVQGGEEVPELVLEAVNRLSAQENASLATGGALAGGGVRSRFDADLDAEVNIGRSELSSRGDMTLSTLTRSSVLHDASANTWGGAAATNATASTSIDDRQSIDVADGASLLAWGYLSLAPGLAADWGQENRLSTITTANSLVRGIVAIADAKATANQNSDVAINIGNGANLLAGRDVELTAYNDEVVNTVEGLAKGYQAGFIPIEDKDSRRDASVTANLRLDGNIRAGVFDRLDIRIDENGELSYNEDSAAPFLAVEQRFNPTTMINKAVEDGDIEAPVAEVIKRGIVDRDVDAWFLDGLFASGGDVVLRARSIEGSGSIDARGGPTITVENDSAHYLRLGRVSIPDNPGGNLRFKGLADSLEDSISVSTTGADRDALISISNNRTEDLSGSDYGPALFQEDEIANESGTVNINVANGAFASLSSLRGRIVSVSVEGPMIVNPIDGGYWSPGQTPEMIWDDYADLPTAREETNRAVAYAAYAYYGDKLDDDNEDLLEDNRDFTSGGKHFDGRSTIIFGGCLPGVFNDGGTAACTYDTAASFGFGVTQVLDIDGTGSDSRQSHVPIVPEWSLDKEASKRSDSGYSGNTVWKGSEAIAIDADIIDVNGTIKTGRKTERGVHLLAALDEWVEHQREAGVNSGKSRIPAFFFEWDEESGFVQKTLWEWRDRGWSEQIEAYYDFSNDQVVIDDVKATGGGYLYMKGEVINSSGNGQIDVESGYGHIDVVNDSSADLELNRLDTGSGSVGMVVIADERKDVTAWYRYTQGEGLDKFVAQGTEGVSIEDASHQRLAGSSASFTPQSGTRWKWTERAYFSRNYDVDRPLSDWMEDWVFDDKRDPWKTYRSGQLVRDESDGSAYRQETDGKLYSGTSWNVKYTYGCPDTIGETCDNGMKVTETYKDGDKTKGRTWWRYYYPTRGYVEVTRSARVDYPIHIDFAGFDAGRVSIDNGGDVRLRGEVDNPSGLTDIRSREGAILSGDRLLKASEVRLEAEKTVGTSTLPLQLSMTAAGPVTAISRTAGINLDIDSDARLARIDAADGKADVVIDATGSLLAGNRDGGRAHITARNLDLTSRVGAVGGLDDLLVIDLHEADDGDGGVRHGVLNVNAERDVGIEDREGDLWVGSVTSDFGDVRLVASSGRIRDAERRLGGDAVDAETREQIWERLRLRDKDGGQARAEELTVPAFEAKVEQAYADYWRLMASGSLEDGEFRLDDDGLERYRTLLSARGQASDDASLQAFAAAEYERLGETFADALGDNWQDTPVFASYREDFSFRVSAAQRERLTDDAVWTDDELRRSINVVALESGSGSTVDEAPNVSARNVTLDAARDVGEVAEPVTIDYQDLLDGNLTEAEIGALAMARAPGDVTIETDASGDIVSLEVNQTIPLYVDPAGRFDLFSDGSTYIQGLNNLRIGEMDVARDARLLANDNITVASGSPGLVRVGGNLTLGASAGSIGDAAGDPLSLDVDGTLLGASASGDIALEWLNGDFGIGRVIADGSVLLAAPNGRLHRTVDGLNVSGQSVDLRANGDIGEEDTAIDLRLTGADGRLRAVAGDSLFLTAAETLRVERLEAGASASIVGEEAVELVEGGSVDTGAGLSLAAAEVRLGANSRSRSAGDAVIASDTDLVVEAQAGIDVLGGLRLAASDLEHGENSRVEAGGTSRVDAGHWQFGEGSAVRVGSLDADIDRLTMAAHSVMHGVHGVDAKSANDMVLSRVSVDDGRLALASDGEVRRADPDWSNLYSAGGGELSLTAAGDIGAAGAPLVAQMPMFDCVESRGGNVYLDWIGAATGGDINADDMVVLEAYDGEFFAQRLKAGDDARLTVRDGGLSIGSLTTGMDLDVIGEGPTDIHLARSQVGGRALIDHRGPGTVTLGTRSDSDWAMDVGESLSIDSDGSVSASRVRAGTTIRLDSFGDVDAGLLAAGDWLEATVDAGDLTVREANSGGAMRLQTENPQGGDVTFGYPENPDEPIDHFHLDSGDSLHIEATGNVRGGNARAMNDVDIRGYDLQFGQVVSRALDVYLQAERNISGARVIAHRDLGIVAGDTLSLDDTRWGGTLSLKAGRDMTVATGGDIDLTGQIEAGRDMTITSRTGYIRADGAKAGNDMTLTAAGDVRFARQIQAGGDLSVDAGGELFVGEFIDVGRNASITSAGSSHVGDHARAGGYLDWQVGGDLLVGRSITAERAHLDLDVHDSLVTRALVAGTTMDVITGGSTLDLDRAVAGDSMRLDVGTRNRRGYADDGVLSVGEMAGSAITLRAADRVSIDEVRSSDLLDIAGRWIEIGRGVYVGDEALGLQVRGLNEEAAENLQADLVAERVESEVLYAGTSRITQDGRYASFADARYVDRFGLSTWDALVTMDNLDPSYEGADVQLRELDREFWLIQDGTWSETDAYVLHRRPTHQVTVPNFAADHDDVEGVEYTGSSAARYIERTQGEFRVFDGFRMGFGWLPDVAISEPAIDGFYSINLDMDTDRIDDTSRRPEEGREI